MATLPEPRSDDLYEQDFYAWAKQQAALLRAGHLAELDLEHLIEEVNDLGEALNRSVRSRTRTIIERLLKLEHSPAKDPRPSWRSTVRTQRCELSDELTASLRQILQDELEPLYERGRWIAEGALRDHGEDAAAESLPESCPYTLDQITGDWLP